MGLGSSAVKSGLPVRTSVRETHEGEGRDWVFATVRGPPGTRGHCGCRGGKRDRVRTPTPRSRDPKKEGEVIPGSVEAWVTLWSPPPYTRVTLQSLGGGKSSSGRTSRHLVKYRP